MAKAVRQILSVWLRAGTLLATVGPVKRGKTDPVPSWGSMLQEASNVVSIADFPWALAPAGAIFLVALAFNLIVQGQPSADPRHGTACERFFRPLSPAPSVYSLKIAR